jgi:hypothetical protein
MTGMQASLFCLGCCNLDLFRWASKQEEAWPCLLVAWLLQLQESSHPNNSHTQLCEAAAAAAATASVGNGSTSNGIVQGGAAAIFQPFYRRDADVTSLKKLDATAVSV